MNSGSSRVHALLSTWSGGTTFTSKSIQAELPDVSKGAISGFLNRAAHEGALTAVGKVGREISYFMADAALIKKMQIGRTAKAGSKPGRLDGQHRHRRFTTRKALSEQLLRIAADLEAMRLPLADVPTEDLLKELMRRQK